MAAIDISSNPSLNQIVSSLAARINKPHDVGLMAELKHIVNYKKKAAIYAWIAKMGISDYLMQTIKAKTIRVPASECNDFPTDCYIVRTECKIPEPYRNPLVKMAHQLFEYVGHISGYSPYAYLTRESLFTLAFKPFTSKAKKWFYSDQYIYVVNDKTAVPTDGEEPPMPIDPAVVGSVMIRGVFADPLTDYECDVCDTTGNVCAPDDLPYPVPPELLDQIILSILSVELASGDLPKDQWIKKDEIKTDSVEGIQHQNV